MSSFGGCGRGLGLVAAGWLGLAGCAAGEDSSIAGVPYQPGADAGNDVPGGDDGGLGDSDDDRGGDDTGDGEEPDDDAADGDPLDEGPGDDEDDGTDESTSGAAMGTTGGQRDEGTDGTEPSTGDDGPVDPPGTQPSSGMWASCEPDDISNCDGADNCVGSAANGFCSLADCVNPAQDCADAPAETSVTPICAAGGMTSVCALDCSSAACPTSMVCTKVSIDGGPEHDICL